ncbi:hypothetical protein AnigIFM59636_001319 [Aspergillus niger]|nr:hypothetical protein M747DRAFT_303375 [Aspergillus niger ATCC 13496]GKZ97734.1 hypothetical protein AnigIFM59636_001319 [Aspergillus niger]
MKIDPKSFLVQSGIDLPNRVAKSGVISFGAEAGLKPSSAKHSEADYDLDAMNLALGTLWQADTFSGTGFTFLADYCGIFQSTERRVPRGSSDDKNTICKDRGRHNFEKEIFGAAYFYFDKWTGYLLFVSCLTP